MKEKRYLIKEAAALVGVESHVLRYWEEELKMDIHRNGMGHRYYTEKDIEILSKVHTLKEKGLQLKAIRNYLDMRRSQISNGDNEVNVDAIHMVVDSESSDFKFFESLSSKLNDSELNASESESSDLKNYGLHSLNSVDTDRKTLSVEDLAEQPETLIPIGTTMLSSEAKMEQFQQMMNRIVSNAIQENNELIGKSAGEHAANAVVTQISGMTKEQEERAEARYQKLDQTLREIQRARLEAAATNMRPIDRRRQKRLKKKGGQQFPSE